MEFQTDDIGLVDSLGLPSAVTITDDGRYVIVTSSSEHAITVFERETSFGSLTFVEDHEDGVGGVFGLFGASDVDSSPDGRHVYVTGAYDDSLAVFARDATTDSLTFVPGAVQVNNVGGVYGLDGPSGVTVSPDDRYVFVTAEEADALAVFSRDATNDALTFIEAEIDDVGGANGLGGASDVAVSADSQHIYATGRIDDALAFFERQPDGTLEPVTHYQDGVDGVDGLDGACGVVISPDGLNVYAVGEIDNAISMFSRNVITGDLTYIGVVRDGNDDVEGLGGASSIAISTFGDFVLVTGRDDDAVALFQRDVVSGSLAFITHRQGLLSGTRGAVSVTVSPDTMHTYVASRDDDAVTGFAITQCIGDVSAGDSDGDGICDVPDPCLDNPDLDGCEPLECTGDPAFGDSDGDGVCEDIDVCQGNDASGDTDSDGVCDDEDCAPTDAAASIFDACGICGGDGLCGRESFT